MLRLSAAVAVTVAARIDNGRRKWRERKRCFMSRSICAEPRKLTSFDQVGTLFRSVRRIWFWKVGRFGKASLPVNDAPSATDAPAERLGTKTERHRRSNDRDTQEHRLS